MTDKKAHGYNVVGFDFFCDNVHVLQRVPYDHHLKQPNSGGTFPPLRFLTYCLHCKNAANSAPPNLMRSSHNEPRNIQIMSTTAMQIATVDSDFCDIALYSLSERR